MKQMTFADAKYAGKHRLLVAGVQLGVQNWSGQLA